MPNKDTAAHYIATGVVGSFSPSDWGVDLTRWYREQFTVTSSPDIDAWVEENGNGNATQSTAAMKPHLVSGVINGRDITRFDESDDFFDIGNPLQATLRTDWLFGCVVDFTDGQPAVQNSLLEARNAASEDWVTCRLLSAGNISIYFESNDNSGAFTSNDILSNGAQSPMGLIFWCDKSGTDSLRVYKVQSSIVSEMSDNGVSTGDLSSVTVSDYTSIENPYIGARNNFGTTSRFLGGDLAEVVIAKNGTAARVTELGNYMISRYAL